MISLPLMVFLATFMFIAGTTFGYALCGALISAAEEIAPAADDDLARLLDAGPLVVIDSNQPAPGMW